MMENIPIDTSHPAVRDYLALIRCGHARRVDIQLVAANLMAE